MLTDADLSTPIECLPLLLRHSEEADVMVGSRAVEDSRIGRRQAPFCEFLGKGYNRLLRLMRLTDLYDTQCGFKLLRGDLAREVADRFTIDGFAFDVGLLWHLIRLGARLKEVGVVWNHSSPSKVHLPRHSVQMLRDAPGFRFRTLWMK